MCDFNLIRDIYFQDCKSKKNKFPEEPMTEKERSRRNLQEDVEDSAVLGATASRMKNAGSGGRAGGKL